jgi:hypothetical protein
MHPLAARRLRPQAYKTFDGRPANKLWFVSWIPHNATHHEKMNYTYTRKSLREVVVGVFDVTAASQKELEEGLGLREVMASSEDESDMSDF